MRHRGMPTLGVTQSGNSAAPSGRIQWKDAFHALRFDRCAVFAPPVATIRRSFGANFTLKTLMFLDNPVHRTFRLEFPDSLTLGVGMALVSQSEQRQRPSDNAGFKPLCQADFACASGRYFDVATLSLWLAV